MSKTAQISKNNLIRLEQYKSQRLVVRFQGGRELSGVLMSFDGGINMIFGKATENPSLHCSQSRELGVAVVRGALIMSIFPQQGFEEIQNPFEDNDEEQQPQQK